MHTVYHVAKSHITSEHPVTCAVCALVMLRLACMSLLLLHQLITVILHSAYTCALTLYSYNLYALVMLIMCSND